MRKGTSILVLFVFLITCILPPSGFAQAFSAVSQLPQPGAMVRQSEAYSPALLRGMVIHPETPLQFDFIVDPGDGNLSGDALSAESQRMINYFLASLAIPEKDLWVNLSPTENDRIIPDALIKTELGRDLLAQDYILKQLTASLIYPEDDLGKTFWQRVYAEAFQKFGTVDVPVDVFNKVWIVPERATVIEKGNTVYIAKAHLKVMLEADYQAQGKLGEIASAAHDATPVDEMTKQVLREVVVPAIEREVNEGKNFAQLRQVIYAMILAQWYEDVSKESVLNKVYAGRSKVAGIDLSDPKNKEMIYEQYMAAYKKGVFDYIKEETDRLTNEPVPKKYFSGGIIGTKVERVPADPRELSNGPRDGAMLVSTRIAGVPSESDAEWYGMDRPVSLHRELVLLFQGSDLVDEDGLRAFMNKYSAQVAAQELYPVEGAWPVLKAVALLEKKQEQALVESLLRMYPLEARPVLVDKILLMQNDQYSKEWLQRETPHLVGRTIYNVAAEVYPAEGGLGEVMQNEGKGEAELGADTVLIQPWYIRKTTGEVLNYDDPVNIGFKSFEKNFDEFTIEVDGKDVVIKVARAVDANGVPVYLYRDERPDGSSFAGNKLYHYGEPDNPVTKEQSMIILNKAAAKLIQRLEQKRKQAQGDQWKPAIVGSNDGQFSPLYAILLSLAEVLPEFMDVVKGMLSSPKTHTFGNRGASDTARGLAFMKDLGILPRYFNAGRAVDGNYIDHTNIGLNLASVGIGGEDVHGVASAVSVNHANAVRFKNPNIRLLALTNGAMPKKLAKAYDEAFEKLQREGKISANADLERPTAEQNALVKEIVKTVLNGLNLKSVTRRRIQVALEQLLVGYVRRLVTEKAGASRAFTRENVLDVVAQGGVFVLVGRYQGPQSEALRRYFTELEKEVAALKERDPGKYKGDFFFMDNCSPTEKGIILSALDLMVQDSDFNTGAAEYSEEFPKGALVATSYDEGVIERQGTRLWVEARNGGYEIKNPGEGNTLKPHDPTPESWRKTVFAPSLKLWKENRQLFNLGSAKTAWQIRIMEGRITAADNLREYEKALARKETEDKQDTELIAKLSASLRGKPDAIEGILERGRNGLRESFRFRVGHDLFPADSWDPKKDQRKGLNRFIEKMQELETTYGYDSFLGHYVYGHFQSYLMSLFSGLEGDAFLREWMLQEERSMAMPIEKWLRLRRLLINLNTALKDPQLRYPIAPAATPEKTGDKAQAPGGIDVRNIGVDRQGELMAGVMSDKALEEMLMNVSGVHGVIIGITPIPDLFTVLGVTR